jgi:ankyrin repeat protein
LISERTKTKIERMASFSTDDHEGDTKARISFWNARSSQPGIHEMISCFRVAFVPTGAESSTESDPVSEDRESGVRHMKRRRLRLVLAFGTVLALSASRGTLLSAQQPSESADGMTALHWAARSGDVAAAAAAIKAGAKLEAATRVGAYTPLHVASKEGHAAVVKALLTAGSNARAVTSNKTTALHLAAAAGSVDAIAALLDHGADVNAREGAWEQTPLIFAAANNRVEAINLLLRRGATVDLSTKTIDLPTQDAVDRAAERRRDQVLEEFRALVPESERAAWRPTPSQVQAAMRAAREIQQSPAGTDLRTAEPDDQPAAATAGDEVPGYSASVGTQGGLTALLHAVRQGHREAVFALLDGGANINKVSGDRTSPLLIATMNGHFDLALELLKRGADPNITNDGGATPLFVTINLQWAPRARYPQPRAHDQQLATYLDMMKALLQAGADPNARNKKHLWFTSFNFCCSVSVQGGTAFFRAAYGTDVEAMKLLVAHGADPNIPTTAAAPRARRGGGSAQSDPSGMPPTPEGGPAVFPLHAASGVGYGEGFESNAHRHAPDGWLPAVKYLVEELGADVNVRDHNGYNAVHHAASRGDNELIRYLVSKGADVTAISRRGQTTADMANGPYQRTSPYPETIALLERLGSKNNHKCVGC